MTADVVALSLSVIIAYALWAAPMRGQSAALYLELAPLLTIFIVGYGQRGLYPGFGLGPVESLKRLSTVTAFAFLILAAFSFVLKLPHLYSRVTFTIAFVASLALVPAGRLLVYRLARRWPWWSEPVAIVGTGRRAVEVVRGLQHTRHIGYQPIVALSIDPQTSRETVGSVPVIGNLDHAEAVAALGVRVALLESDQSEDRRVIDVLHRHFRHVVLLREYDDLPVEGIQIRNLGALVGIEYTNNLLLPGNRTVKRSLDVIVGSVALLLAAPIVLACAALVRLLDGSPAFYTQSRMGLDGRVIAVPKIRTMKRDADRRLKEYLATDPALEREWKTRYKLRDDPRLIPVIGRILRRFSLDELPQLWTVLCGHMSLVGPRPLPDYHLAEFPTSFLELRQRVRPGITGLWQIAIRSEGGVEEQQAFDAYYIRNWSVWLDIYLLGRTLMAVLRGRGAF